MANMIQSAKDSINDILARSYQKASQAGLLPAGAELSGTVEIPKDNLNGDFAANHAMAGAKQLHMAPRKIAEALIANMELKGSWFSSVEAAGPGFINFRLADSWYADVLKAVTSQGDDYGRSNEGQGRKVMVEFVSANPTGPMHMGNARGGVLGDALASVLDRVGYNVWREFYVNDAGNQIEKFANSIDVRYQQLLLGEDKVEFPEDGYHGDDIKELAKLFRESHGDGWLNLPTAQRHEAMAKFGLERNIPKMKSDLLRYGIKYDQWFFESSLHESGYVAETVDKLTQRGYTYEKDGALWLRTSQILREHYAKAGKSQEEIERLDRLAEYGLSVNIPKMKEDLLKYGIVYDQWFFESSLHESGYVAETVQMLTDKGWTYEKDGALWLNTTKLLKEKYLREGKTQEQVDKLDLKDDVLRRANGFYTYFAADIAYHRNKLEVRGFDLAINIWGADHHGHVARLQAALDGLGLDGSHRLVVVLMQLVNLMQDGKPVRMSKRSGKAIALHDLLDEISVDAARYFFNSRTSTSPLDFDLDLAVRQDSENPVYYVQYAHARICSLIARLEEEGEKVPAAAGVDAGVMATGEELALIKTLAQFPEEIHLAARDYDPSRINRYLVSLAGDFHRFYNACRIKGEEHEILAARLKLADTVRAVLANGLGLLGVSAPEKM